MLGISGECEVNVIQHGEVQLQTSVSFDAVSVHVPSLEVVSYTDDDECSPPSSVITLEGILYCQHPCSLDEVLLLLPYQSII